jgi:16S rRNA (uracil1498-N3)-methyltransferase
MHQFFVESNLELNQPVQLPADVVRQIKTVLKLKPMELVWLSNGSKLVEGSLQSDLTVLPKRSIETPQRSVQVVLYAALIRKERFELMLQKATELGVDRIVPLIMERNVVKWEDEPRKLQRYTTILKEAAEQCHRVNIPHLDEPQRLRQVDFDGTDTLLVAYEELSLTQPLSQVPLDGKTLGIVIGPEGGISSSEFDYLKSKGGIPVGLGPRILRAETAALVALTTLNTRIES